MYWHQTAMRGSGSGVNPVGGKGYFEAVAEIAEGQNAGRSHHFEVSGDGRSRNESQEHSAARESSVLLASYRLCYVTGKLILIEDQRWLSG